MFITKVLAQGMGKILSTFLAHGALSTALLVSSNFSTVQIPVPKIFLKETLGKEIRQHIKIMNHVYGETEERFSNEDFAENDTGDFPTALPPANILNQYFKKPLAVAQDEKGTLAKTVLRAPASLKAGAFSAKKSPLRTSKLSSPSLHSSPVLSQSKTQKLSLPHFPPSISTPDKSDHKRNFGAQERIYAQFSPNNIELKGHKNNANLKFASSPSSQEAAKNFESLFLGSEHTCGLNSLSQISCWGHNDDGELATSSSLALSKTPLPVGISGGVVLFESKREHSCALLADGQIVCWGKNTFAQVAPGNSSNIIETPTLIAGLNNPQAFALGGTQSCLLNSSKTVSCWGDNMNAPFTLSNLTNVEEISAMDHQTCARVGNRNLTCWSGVGSTFTSITGANSGNLNDLKCGRAHCCILLANKRINCWGEGGNGQLGNGTNTDSLTVRVSVGTTTTKALSLASGANHTCGLGSDGKVFCWGDNTYGQLGQTNLAASAVPQTVNLSDVKKIFAGGNQSCALLNSGELRCWGDNQYFQLGDFEYSF